MNTYGGASALITDEGIEIRAGADLKASCTSWGGYLTIEGQHWGVVKNLWSGHIRLPNGKSAVVRRVAAGPAWR